MQQIIQPLFEVFGLSGVVANNLLQSWQSKGEEK